MRGWIIASVTIGMLLPLAVARGQIPPPFFGGGATAFDPVVGVLQSGALLDVQATVSDDRKYVTMTTRLDNSRVRALVPFPVVVTEAQGFVGGAPLPGAPAAPPNVAPTAPRAGTGAPARGTAAAPTAAAPTQTS